MYLGYVEMLAEKQDYTSPLHSCALRSTRRLLAPACASPTRSERKRVVEKRMGKVCWTSDSQSLFLSGAGGAEMKSQWGRNEVAVGLPCWTGVIGAWTARVTRQHQTWARALARCCGVVGGPALHIDVGSEEEKRRFVWAKVVAGSDFRSNIRIGTQTYLCEKVVAARRCSNTAAALTQSRAVAHAIALTRLLAAALTQCRQRRLY